MRVKEYIASSTNVYYRFCNYFEWSSSENSGCIIISVMCKKIEEISHNDDIVLSGLTVRILRDCVTRAVLICETF